MSLFTRRRRDRDPIADHLHELERQGAGMARGAHIFSTLLILLFSAASVVSLAADALRATVQSLHHGGVDIPSLITVAISFLIVPAFDWGMLYGANTIRLMQTRGSRKRDMALHIVVVVFACIVEGAGYIYMAAIYDHPTTAAAWALIFGRGLTAPFMAVYLALARALPVTSRDVLYVAEGVSADGVLHGIAAQAGDPDATLHEKMETWHEVATMLDADRRRVQGLMGVLARQAERRAAPLALPTAGRPSTGPGSPLQLPVRTPDLDAPPDASELPSVPALRPVRTGKRTAASRAADVKRKRRQRETQIAAWLAEDPTIATRELVRRLRRAEHSRVSESTVSEIRHVVEARMERANGEQIEAAQ
jgi:hypothetical protein